MVFKIYQERKGFLLNKQEFEKKIDFISKDILQSKKEEKEKLEEQLTRLEKLLPQMLEDTEMMKIIALTFNEIRDDKSLFTFSPVTVKDSGMSFMVALHSKEEKIVVHSFIAQAPSSKFNISFNEEYFVANAYCFAFYPEGNYFSEVDTENRLSRKIILNAIAIKSFCDNYEELHKKFHEWLDSNKIEEEYRITKWKFFDNCRVKRKPL